eukprot:6208201-Pleurochrysis_carterae.AAC.2
MDNDRAQPSSRLAPPTDACSRRAHALVLRVAAEIARMTQVVKHQPHLRADAAYMPTQGRTIGATRAESCSPKPPLSCKPSRPHSPSLFLYQTLEHSLHSSCLSLHLRFPLFRRPSVYASPSPLACPSRSASENSRKYVLVALDQSRARDLRMTRKDGRGGLELGRVALQVEREVCSVKRSARMRVRFVWGRWGNPPVRLLRTGTLPPHAWGHV